MLALSLQRTALTFFSAALDGCACDAERSARAAKWRELCERFYFHQEAGAKRVLDRFEACKLDELACVSCLLQQSLSLSACVRADCEYLTCMS